MMTDLILPLIASVAFRLPLLIVYVVGLLMTSQARQQQRLPERAATLIMVGLALALVGAVLSSLLQLLTPFLMTLGDVSIETIGLTSGVASVVMILLSSVAWMLVIMGALERGKGDF